MIEGLCQTDAGLYPGAAISDTYVRDGRRLAERTLAVFDWPPDRLRRRIPVDGMGREIGRLVARVLRERPGTLPRAFAPGRGPS